MSRVRVNPFRARAAGPRSVRGGDSATGCLGRGVRRPSSSPGAPDRFRASDADARLGEPRKGEARDGHRDVAHGDVEVLAGRDQVEGDARRARRRPRNRRSGCSPARITAPTAISTIPMMCMNDVAFIGSRPVASGLRYAGQLASRLKYLSSPARNAVPPSATRRAHQGVVSRSSFISVPPAHVREPRREKVTTRRQE